MPAKNPYGPLWPLVLRGNSPDHYSNPMDRRHLRKVRAFHRIPGHLPSGPIRAYSNQRPCNSPSDDVFPGDHLRWKKHYRAELFDGVYDQSVYR